MPKINASLYILWEFGLDADRGCVGICHHNLGGLHHAQSQSIPCVAPSEKLTKTLNTYSSYYPPHHSAR